MIPPVVGTDVCQITHRHVSARLTTYGPSVNTGAVERDVLIIELLRVACGSGAMLLRASMAVRHPVSCRSGPSRRGAPVPATAGKSDRGRFRFQPSWRSRTTHTSVRPINTAEALYSVASRRWLAFMVFSRGRDRDRYRGRLALHTPRRFRARRTLVGPISSRVRREPVRREPRLDFASRE